MTFESAGFLRYAILLLAVLAVGALFAASARAEGEWTVEEVGLASLETSSESTETEATANFVLTSKVLGKAFSLSCTKEASSGASILVGGTASEEISLSGCTVSEPAGCSVTQPIVLKTSSEPNQISEVLYEVFVPASGTSFGSIKVSGCAIAGTYPLKGNLAAEIKQFGIELVEQPLTFSAAISAAAGTALKLGAEAANLQGGARRRVIGPNFGRGFGIAPIKPETQPVAFPKTVFPNVAIKEEKIKIAPRAKVKFAVIQIVGGGGVFSKEADGCSGNEFNGGEECALKFKFTPPNGPAEQFGGQGVVAWELKPKGAISGVVRILMFGES